MVNVSLGCIVFNVMECSVVGVVSSVLEFVGYLRYCCVNSHGW
jgi:hypothetical protein